MGPREQVTRTRARQRHSTLPVLWLVAVAIIAASGVVAGVLVFKAAEPNAPPYLLAWGVLIGGGAVAGLLLGARGRSRWAFAGALLAPLPVFLPLCLLALVASDTAEALNEWIRGLAALLALWEGPLVVGYAIAHVRSRDSVLFVPSPVRFDPQPEAASAGVTIPTVIREYSDDAKGWRRLAADTEALAARGYGVVAVEFRPSAVREALDWIIEWVFLSWSPSDRKVVATFRLGAAQPAQGLRQPGPPGDARQVGDTSAWLAFVESQIRRMDGGPGEASEPPGRWPPLGGPGASHGH